MTEFEKQIAADNAAVFINALEFAGEHDLNGTVCKAILQDISVADADIDARNRIAYGGIYGSRLLVNCLEADLPEVPAPGSGFNVDGRFYFVESCADDMGILTIQLAANER